MTREPGWDGAFNLRDLGGLPTDDGATTRSGVVYRSGAREWMTDRGWAEAKAAGLDTIVDLRNAPFETRREDYYPRVLPESETGVTVVVAPVEDPTDREYLATAKLDHPAGWDPNLERYPALLGAVFTAIADAGGPVLLHCAGGRDRTGLVTVILLLLNGVTREAVVDDYVTGFRQAVGHEGHGLAYDPATNTWSATGGTPADRPVTPEELEQRIAERRPVAAAWVAEADAAGLLRAMGVDEARIDRLSTLLR